MGNCYNSIVISAPHREVWMRIRDFHDLSWAAGVVTHVEKVGPRFGTEIGAVRVLDRMFRETLVKWNDKAMSFSYSLDDGPELITKNVVRKYLGTVTVAKLSSGEGTFVEWATSFYSANDEEVSAFFDPICQRALQAMKSSFSVKRELS